MISGIVLDNFTASSKDKTPQTMVNTCRVTMKYCIIELFVNLDFMSSCLLAKGCTSRFCRLEIHLNGFKWKSSPPPTFSGIKLWYLVPGGDFPPKNL